MHYSVRLKKSATELCYFPLLNEITLNHDICVVKSSEKEK